MPLLSNMSIRTKLTLIVFVSSFLLLIIVGSGFVAAEFYSSRVALQQEIKTLTASLAANSSQALLLEKYVDEEKTSQGRNLLRKRYLDAEKILASLKKQPHIHAAYLFNKAGKPVAEYLNFTDPRFVLKAVETDFKVFDPVNTPKEARFTTALTHMGCLQPVSYSSEVIGSLYLLSDLSSMFTRIKIVVVGALISFIVLSFCSWFLARRLHKPISEPLLHLAGVMDAVGTSKDYTTRAEKVSADEVGSLVDGFNRMIGQIEDQQKLLVNHQQVLEQTIAERTSELRETVKQLEQARNEADSANEAKSVFLSKMTHELRTPLIGVLGMNELLQRTGLNDQQQLLTETVQNSGEDLLGLISNVLDISRIEAGKMELETGVVDYFRIVEDVIGLLAPKAQEKGLKIISDISGSATWKVHADEGRLRQIVMNLVGNAVKFTTTGRILVRLKCQAEDSGSGLFRLTVDDTGPGMDEQTKANVFEMFYQSNHSGARSQQGTGLGLSIVQQLVEMMSGELTLETVPEKGSCFEVCLSLPLVEKVKFNCPSTLVGQRALVCSEDRGVCAPLVRCLSELGLKVDDSSGADELVYQCSRADREGSPYAILLFDRLLKTTSGELIREVLPQTKEGSVLRVILLGDNFSTPDSLQKHETRLSLPLKWSELQVALTRSWESLSVIPGRAMAHNNVEIRTMKVVLLGQNIASRELNRLTLEKRGIDVMPIRALSELPESPEGRILLIDCPYASVDELNDFLLAPRGWMIALVSSRDELQGLVDIDGIVLNKPLTSDSIEQTLKPLFSQGLNQVERK